MGSTVAEHLNVADRHAKDTTKTHCAQYTTIPGCRGSPYLRWTCPSSAYRPPPPLSPSPSRLASPDVPSSGSECCALELHTARRAAAAAASGAATAAADGSAEEEQRIGRCPLPSQGSEATIEAWSCPSPPPFAGIQVLHSVCGMVAQSLLLLLLFLLLNRRCTKHQSFLCFMRGRIERLCLCLCLCFVPACVWRVDRAAGLGQMGVWGWG
jgi:hypothetical protein